MREVAAPLVLWMLPVPETRSSAVQASPFASRRFAYWLLQGKTNVVKVSDR
jgi:hypothetical protein